LLIGITTGKKSNTDTARQQQEVTDLTELQTAFLLIPNHNSTAAEKFASVSFSERRANEDDEIQRDSRLI
jgi:hypothetical protein